MKTITSSLMDKLPLAMAAAAGALLMSAGLAMGAGIEIELSGAEEVPAVTSTATGKAAITVAADKSVSGTVTTKGIAGIAAHIHAGPKGKNGPPVIPLEKTSQDTWSVPAGSKLSDEQYASYKAGELYVNVHSAEHKGGEIRAQLKP